MIAIEKNTFGISEALIQQITEKIVRECHPHKIILFGSWAWGKPHLDSDLDLLIIMDSEVARPDVRAMQVRRLLYDFHCPMDLLVYTPEEIKACLQRGNLFIQEILEEGGLLYARQHVF
jgi:predicted nucleotidyltransferase